jgi:hypothetical protein
VRKAHRDALALIARLEGRFGLHLAPSHIARIFVDIDDESAIDADQAVEPIAELHALVGLDRPSS